MMVVLRQNRRVALEMAEGAGEEPEKDGKGDQAFSPVKQDLPEIHGNKFTFRPEIQEKVPKKGVKTAG